jgi:hypothetical protein
VLKVMKRKIKEDFVKRINGVLHHSVYLVFTASVNCLHCFVHMYILGANESLNPLINGPFKPLYYHPPINVSVT